MSTNGRLPASLVPRPTRPGNKANNLLVSKLLLNARIVYVYACSLDTSFTRNYRNYPSSVAVLRSVCQYAQASSRCTDETFADETFTAEKLVEVLPFLQQNLSSPSSSVRLCENSSTFNSTLVMRYCWQ